MKSEKMLLRSDGVHGILLPYPCATKRIHAAMARAREMRESGTPCVVVFNNRYEKRAFLDFKVAIPGATLGS